MEVGDKVRNMKTRAAGEIVAVADGVAEVAVYHPEPGAEKTTVKVSDLEPLNFKEYTLVHDLARATAEKKAAQALAESAGSAKAAAEDALAKYLQDNAIESTKVYEGVGVGVIAGMKVYPSITEANREAAFAAIRALGRGEIIKEQVHSATLTAFVSELINDGKVAVPESISYMLKPEVKVRKK